MGSCRMYQFSDEIEAVIKAAFEAFTEKLTKDISKYLKDHVGEWELKSLELELESESRGLDAKSRYFWGSAVLAQTVDLGIREIEDQYREVGRVSNLLMRDLDLTHTDIDRIGMCENGFEIGISFLNVTF